MIEIKFFDLITELHRCKKLGNKDQYKLALANLDMLNEDYKMKSGEHFLEPTFVLSFYAKLWEF